MNLDRLLTRFGDWSAESRPRRIRIVISELCQDALGLTPGLISHGRGGESRQSETNPIAERAEAGQETNGRFQRLQGATSTLKSSVSALTMLNQTYEWEGSRFAPEIFAELSHSAAVAHGLS